MGTAAPNTGLDDRLVVPDALLPGGRSFPGWVRGDLSNLPEGRVRCGQVLLRQSGRFEKGISNICPTDGRQQCTRRVRRRRTRMLHFYATSIRIRRPVREVVPICWFRGSIVVTKTLVLLLRERLWRPKTSLTNEELTGFFRISLDSTLILQTLWTCPSAQLTRMEQLLSKDVEGVRSLIIPTITYRPQNSMSIP